LPLSAPVTDCTALLFGIHRLVMELTGFLQARQAGVSGFALKLHHEHRAPTAVTIGLVSASRRATHLMHLIRTRLEQYALPADVHEVELVARDIQPLAEHTQTLFDDADAEQHDDWAVLVEQLRARLGDEAVAGLRLVADHRPEYAWQYGAPGVAGVVPDSGPRPLWLLAEPLLLSERDLHGGLVLHRGPERIESGWWDGGDIARDYFIARHPDGMQWWIFCERHVSQRRWFLHGVFG
jgi:protein ImuB